MLVIALSILTATLALIGTYVAVRPAIFRADASRFCRVREHLEDHVAELVEAAERMQEHLRYDAELPLLTRPGWIPLKPIPLSNVTLSLRKPGPDESLNRAHKRARRYWPRRSGGRFESYSQAIGELAKPKLWFNGPSYRLLEVRTPVDAVTEHGLGLVFSEASYFDGIDTAEPLSYEVALRHMRSLHYPWPGPYRRWLSDAFNLRRRCALPGVDTLTLRVEQSRTTFFLHSRDPRQVASMNTTHVVPAGEFQPHSKDVTVWRSDLNVWHTIMREYAEEFLGAPDAATVQGKVIDFERDLPYADFSDALRDGQVRVYLLGLGLEPMTWKPEICTVCVWDARSFDRIFHHVLERNDEGVLLLGKHLHGVEFNLDSVDEYAKRPEMDPAGRACLTLAWRWRSELGLPALNS